MHLDLFRFNYFHSKKVQFLRILIFRNFEFLIIIIIKYNDSATQTWLSDDNYSRK